MTVKDNGGTTNGGVDTTTRSFTVTVSAVNDPPLLNPISGLTIAASTLKSELRKTSLSENVVFQFTEGPTVADPVSGFGLEDLSLTVSGNEANLIAGSPATLQPNTAGGFSNAFTLKGLASVSDKPRRKLRPARRLL